jgi:hypothetical protein
VAARITNHVRDWGDIIAWIDANAPKCRPLGSDKKKPADMRNGVQFVSFARLAQAWLVRVEGKPTIQ